MNFNTTNDNDTDQNIILREIKENALINSQYDTPSITLPREEKIELNLPDLEEKNKINQGGGQFMKIQCPYTNKLFNLKDKKGKMILDHYNLHLYNKSNNESYCPFHLIINPQTGRKVSIFGKIGKNIIKKYNKFNL